MLGDAHHGRSDIVAIVSGSAGAGVDGLCDGVCVSVDVAGRCSVCVVSAVAASRRRQRAIGCVHEVCDWLSPV
jgi:hypothetical protein